MASAKVIITGNSKDAQKAVGALKSKLSDATAASKGLLIGLGALAAGAVATVIKTIQLAGQMEQTEIAFTSLTGSAEEAQRILQGLKDFAASTPFEFPGIASSTRLLITMGMGADQATNAMKIVADAVAAAGGGQEELLGVSRALGQIQAKGKLSAEELMQLAERGIPAQQILQDELGLTGEQVADIGNQGVSAEEGIEALLNGLTKKFKGAAKEQAKTTLGIWSTFKDNVTMTLIPLGEIFTDVFDIKEIMTIAIENLKGFRESLEDIKKVIEEDGVGAAIDNLIPENMKIIIIGVAGAIAAALIPAFYALATSIYAAIAPLAPFIAIGAAAALIAYELYDNWDSVSKSLSGIWGMMGSAVNLLVTGVKLEFEIMKFAVLSAVNYMLQKLSILENLPFGIGEKFKGMADSIDDSTEESKKRISELSQKAAEDFDNFKQSAIKTGQGISEFSSGVGEDIIGIIDMITGVTPKMKGEIEEQASIVKKGKSEEVKAIIAAEKKKTQKTKEENAKRTKFAAERAKEHQATLDRIKQQQADHQAEMQKKLDVYYAERNRLEADAQNELFDLTATELKKLKKNFEEKKALHESYGADTTALEKKYQLERQTILDEQAAKEKAFNEKRAKEHQATLDRIKQQEQERLEDLQRKVDAYIAEKEREAASEQEIQDKREKEHQATLDRIKQQQADHQADMQKKLDAYFAERESFVQKWNTTELELLNQQEEKVLSKAEELGVTKTVIRQLFADKRKKILDKEKADEEKTLDELLIDYQDFGTGLGNVFGNMKIAIQNWAINMKENTKEASQSFADAMVDMADAVTSGQKTMKEALKDILVSFITMLEKQVIAVQIAEQVKALMMAPLSFGATLAAIPAILAAAAPALIAFEALKAGIRGLAEGGMLLNSGSVMVGERGPELLDLPKGARVTPLNKTTNKASTVNISITGNRISSDMDIDRIGDKMVRKLRMAGVRP